MFTKAAAAVGRESQINHKSHAGVQHARLAGPKSNGATHKSPGRGGGLRGRRNIFVMCFFFSLSGGLVSMVVFLQ